jgi:Ca-activated chloride channel family protein
MTLTDAPRTSSFAWFTSIVSSIGAFWLALAALLFVAAACSSHSPNQSDLEPAATNSDAPSAPGELVGSADPGKQGDLSSEAARAANPSGIGRSEQRVDSGQQAMHRLASAGLSPNDWNTERYDTLSIQGFTRPVDAPLSTFSIDVDTASYANVRRFLRDRLQPPHGAIRIEEMVNYFRYAPVRDQGSEPFSVETEIFVAPWAPEHRLVRIGISGHEIDRGEVPARNLVFLIDVSGSMQGADRLDLVKHGLAGLVEHLRPIDRVSIVVYAGASGLVLPPTAGDDRATILESLARLQAGGSTGGAAGIALAYETATRHFDPNGINRVILATDGDFNVGVTSRSELVRLIEEKRESGVSLTVLGFGRGNLNDSGMEALADKGNGNYAYIDSQNEARKVLVEQANATLITIAKDVKIQVEFNPARVAAYRLLGYENRKLADRDFNDDRKDAGEIGAGHHVTALYEIVPVGTPLDPAKTGGSVDALKYQSPASVRDSADSGEWLTVKLRYKEPAESKSRLLTRALSGPPHSFEGASENGRFSAAVALFGMLLRDSEYKGAGSFEMVQTLGREAMGRDDYGERAEFLQLVALARNLGS